MDWPTSKKNTGSFFLFLKSFVDKYIYSKNSLRTSNEDTKFTRSFTAFSALAKKSCVHVHVDRALTPPSPPLFTCINLKQPTKLYGGKSRAQCGVEAFQKALSLQSCYRNHRKLHTGKENIRLGRSIGIPTHHAKVGFQTGPLIASRSG